MTKKLLALFLVLLIAAVPTVARNPHGGLSGGLVPPLPGFTLAFDDEFTSFNGDSTGSNGWKTQYNFGRTNNDEQECYMDTSVGVNPFSISANGLAIQAAAAGSTTPCGTLSAYPYTSGLISSYTSFYMEYGYWEARVKLPSGQGFWPAFWMEAEGGGWPPEIDIFEELSTATTTIYQSDHYSSGGNQQDFTAVTVADTSTGFHTIAVDWEPSGLVFYFDGMATGISYPARPGLNQAMFMYVNLAVGGAFPGNANGTTPLPSSMQVKWVHVWKGPNSTGEGGSKAMGLILFGIRRGSRRRRYAKSQQRFSARAA